MSLFLRMQKAGFLMMWLIWENKDTKELCSNYNCSVSIFLSSFVTVQAGKCQTWPQGYKTVFMLNSAETEI